MANDNLARRQIIIPTTQQPEEIKLRVAAYCRVSTDSEDQQNSFAAQNTYYTNFIASKENWQLVDIYADEGITGTSAAKRRDFQRLLSDCRAGKVDKVLVKSISRFSRNTKECLETVRELKSLGIGVCFEEQHIDTRTTSSEMLTAVLASCAQAESESISKNLRWSVQKRMESGKYNTCRAPYGYRLVNNDLVVYEEEAATVRRIFSAYLNGGSARRIADSLNKEYPDGKHWDRQAIEYILRNERYAGNAVLRKRYTTDTLPYRIQYNKGEKEMFFVEGSNPPIVSCEEFECAQRLYQSRAAKGCYTRRPQLLAQAAICGCCGKPLRSKPVKGKQYLVCRVHEESLEQCPNKPVPETEVHSAFLRLYYNLKHHGKEIFSTFLDNLYSIRSRQMLWSADVIAINKEISDITSQSHTLALLNQQGLVDSDIFIAKSNQLAQQLRSAKQKKTEILAMENDNTAEKTEQIMEVLDSGPEFVASFDEELFRELVERIIVESNTRLRFRLINGLELPENIERTAR